VNKIEMRLAKLEDIVSKHLQESGVIQTNLKWNTILTGGIAVAIAGRLIFEFLFRK